MRKTEGVSACHEVMQELFQAIKELGGSETIQEIDDKTVEILGLSPEVLTIMHGDISKLEVEHRLTWTRTYMKKVRILENSARGVWALTTVGRELQEINSDGVIKKVCEMTLLKMKDTKEVSFKDHNLESGGVDASDEIQIQCEKLKNVLKNLKPDAFERLTQRLLRESGSTQVKVAGKTGDGRIDGIGIVELNGIISFHMLFQCGRYTGSVSAGEIRDFGGTIQGGADKGLFTTTGKSSMPAIKEASRSGTTPISLVNEDELVSKLRKLQLGVAPVNDYATSDVWFLSVQAPDLLVYHLHRQHLSTEWH